MGYPGGDYVRIQTEALIGRMNALRPRWDFGQWWATTFF